MTSPAAFRVFPAPAEIGEHVAERILLRVGDAERAGRRFLLGLPTGRTPRPVYTAIARRLSAAPQSLAHVTLVMMDEYLVATGSAFAYATATDAPSCHAFTDEEILSPIHAALEPTLRIRDDFVWFPDPVDPDEYDQRIAAAGGIDFFLIASGAGDGHVAFNPPGSALTSTTRIVELSEQTRRDNLLTFPALGTVDKVPRFGVTVGVGTIVAAREVVMVAWGEGKRETVRRMRHGSRYDTSWPATLIHECASGEVVVDRMAAGEP